MSRRRLVETRKINPDPKFGSEILSKFINILMFKGKKNIAEKIVYKALDILSKRIGKNEIDSFIISLNNIKPFIEVKSRRIGGSTYQVPIEIKSSRRNTLAMRWIINFARKRKEKSMSLKLANELYDALNNKGSSIKKKEEIHRLAEANKAFAHYRW
ncbi:30S ribosomal protein S7 [Candidatus Annandia adelgestsuga]|uniref:Small ribosomal subunit protein uS7 n=1 Tax=Candidatus Annandia adelgestsuga TaxID=1302411 RepID=A0A3Q9CLG8_9ENTR|nr:30S ribosomal protein S7 [Candidatus Annandia adelgestsuga]AZP36288.1 30S ribosomal protein S7 [Candidatus Annandia adelgestsuga]